MQIIRLEHRPGEHLEALEFIDTDGQAIQIITSGAVADPASPAVLGSDFLRLRIADRGIHLSRDMVAELLPHLWSWLRSGSLADQT